tara:strand:- start:81 stop:344 length:264 start_codon:yes stop_codon:yes gene_type:complete
MDTKIIRAIQKINPSAEVSVSNDDINTIVWENGTTPIAIADIEAKIPEVETEIANEKADKTDLKASAKAKLIAGEALTEEEANTIVL